MERPPIGRDIGPKGVTDDGEGEEDMSASPAADELLVLTSGVAGTA